MILYNKLNDKRYNNSWILSSLIIVNESLSLNFGEISSVSVEDAWFIAIFSFKVVEFHPLIIEHAVTIKLKVNHIILLQ